MHTAEIYEETLRISVITYVLFSVSVKSGASVCVKSELSLLHWAYND